MFFVRKECNADDMIIIAAYSLTPDYREIVNAKVFIYFFSHNFPNESQPKGPVRSVRPAYEQIDQSDNQLFHRTLSFHRLHVFELIAKSKIFRKFMSNTMNDIDCNFTFSLCDRVSMH